MSLLAGMLGEVPLVDESEERWSSTPPTLDLSLDTNPDAYAKTVKVAREANLSPDLVEGVEDDVEQRNKARALQLYDMQSEGSMLGKIYADKTIAKLAHDDVYTLDWFDKLKHNTSTYGNEIAESFGKGTDVVDMGDIGSSLISQRMSGTWSDEDEAKLRALASKSYNESDRGWVAGVPLAMSEMTPMLWEVGTDTLAGAAAGGATGLAVGAVTGIGAVATGTTGAVWGANVASLVSLFQIESGAALGEFISMTDEQGNPLGRDAAIGGAILTGLINAPLERLGIAKTGKIFTGGKKALQWQVKHALKDPEFAKRMTGLAGRYADAVATGGVTEFMQEVSNIAFGELAKYYDDDSFKTMTLADVSDTIFSKETFDRAGAAAKVGFQAAAGFGAVGMATTVAMDWNQTQSDFTTDQQKLNQLEEIDKNSKLKKRDPVTYKQVIDEITGDQRVYMDREAAAKLVSSLEASGDTSILVEMLKQKLGEAGDSGNIELTVGEYATEVVGSQHHDAIRPHIKMNENSITQSDYVVSENEAVAHARKLMADATVTQDELSASEAIYEKVVEQIAASGVHSTTDARIMAQVVPAHAASLAKDLGISIEEVYQRMGLDIEGSRQAEATALGVIPRSAFRQQQDLSSVTFPAEERMMPNGERVTLTRNAQAEWDSTAQRRGVAETLMGCLHG